MPNRKNITWITKDGKHVPIGSHYGKRQDEFENKFIMQHVGSRAHDGLWDGAIARMALCEVLKAPILSELYTAYVLADSIYDNWDLINRAYEAYERQDWDSLSKLLQSNFVRNELSDIQTDLAWAAISRCVPSAFQKEGKELLSKVMTELTSAEVSFATTFLRKQRKKGKPSRSRTLDANREGKIPDGVNYF